MSIIPSRKWKIFLENRSLWQFLPRDKPRGFLATKIMKMNETIVNDFGPDIQWSRKGTLDKKVLRYLKKKFHIETMVDVGCGEGRQVNYAIKIGIDAIGVDGSPVSHIYKKEHIIRHDYVLGKADLGNFDLCWTVEFVEHVFDRYIPNFMDTIARCRFVLCTHAIPGQKGIHHVNCQDEMYWIQVFEKYGFDLDEQYTAKIRRIATVSHIKKNGLFFRNTDSSQSV